MTKQILPIRENDASPKPFTTTAYGGKNMFNHEFKFWILLLNNTHQCTQVFNRGLFASIDFDDLSNSSQNSQHLFMKCQIWTEPLQQPVH